MVKTRPPATETLEYPAPTPEALQARRGPSFGQVLRRPVSLEIPSRFSPLHAGHSPVAASRRSGAQRVKQRAVTMPIAERLRAIRSPFSSASSGDPNNLRGAGIRIQNHDP